MTASTVRQLAQSDPVPNLTARMGNVAMATRNQIEGLVGLLRELDGLHDTLQEHSIDVTVDLGPIGNAAAAARRDLERERPTPFEMPR